MEVEAPGWVPLPSAAAGSEVCVLQPWPGLPREGAAAEWVESGGFRGLDFGHFP